MNHNLKDLDVISDILPLFDYTLNDFSKEVLSEMLLLPLNGIPEILERQNIIKAFLKNYEVFETYSYSKSDFHEIFSFLRDNSLSAKKKLFGLTLFFPEKQKQQLRSKIIQFVIVFNKIESSISQKLNTDNLPAAYRNEFTGLINFLSSLKLKYYDTLIRESKLRTHHAIALFQIIKDKQQDNEFELFYKRLFQFETYISIAKSIYKNKFGFPSFTPDKIHFEGIFHPLLKDPVSNNVTFEKNVNLITGPNMSGKSTFLKSVCLSIYLGHLGFAVPASKAEFPFFEYFSIAVNQNDDIKKGYSHFMTEIIGLKNVLEQAGAHKKCFVVFDELFKSTNIDDAIQITLTTIRGLLKFKNSFFFISTHLQQLKASPDVSSDKSGKYYIDCSIENNTPVFTYKLKEGWSDMKIGQLLFEKEGLNRLLSS